MEHAIGCGRQQRRKYRHCCCCNCTSCWQHRHPRRLAPCSWRCTCRCDHHRGRGRSCRQRCSATSRKASFSLHQQRASGVAPPQRPIPCLACGRGREWRTRLSVFPAPCASHGTRHWAERHRCPAPAALRQSRHRTCPGPRRPHRGAGGGAVPGLGPVRLPSGCLRTPLRHPLAGPMEPRPSGCGCR